MSLSVIPVTESHPICNYNGANTILKVHRKENDKILNIGIYFILLVYIYMEGQIIIIRLLLSMESEQEELVR